MRRHGQSICRLLGGKVSRRFAWRIPLALGCLGIAFNAPADAQQAATPATPAPAPVAPPTAGAPQAPARTDANRGSLQGTFSTDVLAGGTVNQLMVEVEPRRIDRLPDAAIAWLENHCQGRTGAMTVRSRASVPNDQTKTILVIDTPAPPCWWPMAQLAKITIKGDLLDPPGTQTLFEQTRPVSVFWLPTVVTLVAIATIYPGCAVTVWMLRRYQFRRNLRPERPTFLSTLDPVQITANPYGRASLAKLQIFLFTLIVFGLLLFFQLRVSVLAALSTDVMVLLGISAVGAAGGKITYVAKRRLRFENWAWLRRKDWLPENTGVATRAKWSELFVDSDTNEFDPYSFQMAIFSIVVALALVRASLSELGSFKIPAELLGLLGLSQVVFIGGKAVEKSAYNELDAKLDEVRAQEAKLREASATAAANTEALRTALRAIVVEAAEGFSGTFRDQLPPDKRRDVEQLAKLAEKDLPVAAARPGG